jgi:hypothetical protein
MLGLVPGGLCLISLIGESRARFAWFMYGLKPVPFLTFSYI